nr:putative polyprotein [Tanacetum cinerariifolium]
MEAEAYYSGSTTTAPKSKKITNQLYNVKVKFEIPSCPMFGTTAIIDTGASACCINKKVIPEEALEPLTQTVFFNGLNSRQQATHRIKQGYFLIEGNKFKIPLIYAFDMRDSNGIEMLIGANFLRSMRGGIRIEGDEITIYKKVTRIKTSNQTKIAEIAKLEVSEEEFLEINESIYFNQEGSKAFLEQFKPVIDRLKHQRPLKHVTPAMEDSFKKHVDSLLKIGAIRPSKSRHRTMAMIVNSGTTIDPVTGKEVKGKERMSGFHQVAMDEESIPWTAFLVPGGLYEWLVMPFGLKNAPAVFQRKMDKCFKGTESFIAVYIDDILVFSKNEKEHAKHLEKMLKICKDNGLVLSPTKMKITVSTIDFLGVVIGEGMIKLQPRIIKKIVNFNEEELKTKNGLRSFLGILNYARNHIPKLRILLRPLYEKTNALGDKRMKSSYYELVRKIKEQVQNLPDLEIPPENAYIILETDGCMEGWGGIVKWKKRKEDPRGSERICAYASGKFSTTQSTIDAEINACINTLEKLKIYYLDKQEVTLRTDCQAIISFYNKTNSNKSLRVRWIKFEDTITRTGVKINIEHIEGKHNTLADSLSRLVNLCFAECTGEMKELAAAALHSAKEVLQSLYTFQKNMKITCEEVMKISNHFHESSQKLSVSLEKSNKNVIGLRNNQSNWFCVVIGKKRKVGLEINLEEHVSILQDVRIHEALLALPQSSMIKLMLLCMSLVQLKLRRHHNSRTGLVHVVRVFLELECENNDRDSYVQPQGHVNHLLHLKGLLGIVIVKWFKRCLEKVHLDQLMLRKVNQLTQLEQELLQQELERQR